MIAVELRKEEQALKWFEQFKKGIRHVYSRLQIFNLHKDSLLVMEKQILYRFQLIQIHFVFRIHLFFLINKLNSLLLHTYS